MTGNTIEIRELIRPNPPTGRADLCALDRVFRAVPPGEVRGLLGPDGASKPTLCPIPSTRLSPSAGRGGGAPCGRRTGCGTGSSACGASDDAGRGTR